MLIVYPVFIHGVYRHKCLGIFTDLEKAKAIARKGCEDEHDDWHDFRVFEFILDRPTPNDELQGYMESSCLARYFKTSTWLKGGIREMSPIQEELNLR